MKVSQLKMGVVLTYFSNALSILISLLYTPIMLDILGQGEYGVYTLANSVVANLGILSFGFGSAYIRFYSKYKVAKDTDGIATLNGMFLTVFSVIALIAFVCGSVLTANIEHLFNDGLTSSEIAMTRVLMRILVVNIAISFPASVFTSYITANEKYIFLKAVNMIKTVFSPLLNLPLLLLGYGSIGMVSVTLAVNLIADIINVCFCLKKLGMRFAFKGMKFHLLKEIWIFSAFIFLNIITDQINWNVDKFVLGMYRNSTAVAIYGVAAHLNTYYISLSHSVSSVFIPRVNKMVASNDSNQALTKLFTRVGRIQFMILSLILFVYLFFGDYFIQMWAGKEYSEAFFVGAILLCSVTIDCIQTLGIEIQRAKNLHKFRSVTCLCIAIANIFVTIPLSIRLGPTGAAIGTALTLLLGNGLLMNIYYHKKVGIDIIYFWKQILHFFYAFLPPTLYGIVMNYYFDITSIWEFILLAAGMVVIYLASIWFFGMDSSEKDLILVPLKKLKASVRKENTI